jgi:hypothetical protein
VTLGAATVLAALSVSRIDGLPWSWLLLWAWGLLALLALAAVWTLAAAVAPRLTPGARRRATSAGALALVALVLVSIGRFTADAARYRLEAPEASVVIGALTPPTVRALSTGARAHGRYLVTWEDPNGIMGPLAGWGIVDELDRRGFSVGVPPAQQLRAAPYLTMTRADATAVMVLAIGPAVDKWRHHAGARAIARYEPRTARQRAEQERLRAEIKGELDRLGLARIGRLMDANLLLARFQVVGVPRVPASLRAKMNRLFESRQPAAVFLVAPADV